MIPAALDPRPLIDPPPTQATVLSALAAKLAKLDARMLQLSEQMAALEQDLASLDGTMRLFVGPPKGQPQETVPHTLPSFRCHELGQEAIAVLQEASYPLSTQEIATAICARRRLSLERGALLSLGQMIVTNLRRAQKRGAVHEVGRTARRALLWFAPSP